MHITPTRLPTLPYETFYYKRAQQQTASSGWRRRGATTRARRAFPCAVQIPPADRLLPRAPRTRLPPRHSHLRCLSRVDGGRRGRCSRACVCGSSRSYACVRRHRGATDGTTPPPLSRPAFVPGGGAHLPTTADPRPAGRCLRARSGGCAARRESRCAVLHVRRSRPPRLADDGTILPLSSPLLPTASPCRIVRFMMGTHHPHPSLFRSHGAPLSGPFPSRLTLRPSLSVSTPLLLARRPRALPLPRGRDRGCGALPDLWSRPAVRALTGSFV
jgi:hypothetical protein